MVVRPKGFVASSLVLRLELPYNRTCHLRERPMMLEEVATAWFWPEVQGNLDDILF